MPATYLHFSAEQRTRKEAVGCSWEEVLEAGISAMESAAAAGTYRPEKRRGVVQRAEAEK